MKNEFYPPRKAGYILQGALLLILLLSGAYFFYLASQDLSGLDFLLHMLLALIILAPFPFLVYRLYALSSGVYILQRDGMMIRWGLRHEVIPLVAVEWVRPATELGFRLHLPWLQLPGAILGSRKIPELGRVEFMAADLKHMILVATPEKVYAISPVHVNSFLATFMQFSELGSLAPIEAQSVYPKVLIGHAWEDRLARILMITSFIIGLVILGIVSIAIPTLGTIEWTDPGSSVPAERLLLLPILEGMIWLFNTILGTVLFRQGDDLRIGAYILWGSAGLTGLLLLLGSLILIF